MAWNSCQSYRGHLSQLNREAIWQILRATASVAAPNENKKIFSFVLARLAMSLIVLVTALVRLVSLNRSYRVFVDVQAVQ